MKDTTVRSEPDSLMGFGQLLVDSLHKHFDTNYVRSVSFQASDTMINSLVQLVSAHLPAFLVPADYVIIDSLLRNDAIKRSLERDYHLLLTPGSMVMKKKLMNDPLGITNLAYKKLSSFQGGSQFTLYNGCVFTRDLKHLLIFIEPKNPVNETSMNGQLLDGLDKILKSGAAPGGKINAEYFGAVAMSVSNAKQLKKDIALTLAIAFALIFILLGCYFRSIRVPLLGLLPALFGGGLALAILFLIKGHVSAISLGIGSVILGLIVDYSLYMINHFRRRGNIESVLREMSQTILVCSITSAGAFLCLVFLNSAVLHDLGWFAALSVLGAALFALVFLPQFFSVKRDRPLRGNSRNPVDRFASIRFEKNLWVAGIVAVLVGLGVIYAPKAGFEKNLYSLGYVTPKLSAAETNLDRISNLKLKNITLVAAGRDPETALRNSEKLSSWKSSMTGRRIIAEISDAGSLLLSDSLQRERIRYWNAFWTAERIATVRSAVETNARTFRFREGVFDGFCESLGKTYTPLKYDDPGLKSVPTLGDWITIKPGMTLITSMLRVKAQNRATLFGDFRAGKDYLMFDKQLLTDRFVASVKHDFNLLVLFSMIFVSILLVVSFGRIELGLMTALPMFLSWLITLGFMGLTGIKFNIFNIIISSFIFGLGVDYSILMMRGLQHAYKTGNPDISAYKISILLSSATTLIGVGVLFFAKHPALHSIALIAFVGIISVVMLTFFIIPFLFNALIINRVRRKKFPITARIMLKTFVTWGNIVTIAVILMITGWILYLFFPVRRKKKEYWFHWLFSKLSRADIAFTFACDSTFDNPAHEDFSKLGIIISNHQSLIETPAFLRLHPKIIILTTTWVHKSPIFGPIAHLANFSNVENGIDNIIDQLQEKIDEGFSILIFPEGHRSADHQVHRFHRGAFYLAEKLKVDIIPLVVFGSGDFLPKDSFWGRPNHLAMRVLPRVSWNDPGMSNGYVAHSKHFRKIYHNEYERFKSEQGTAEYYRRRLLLNFVFKGPILEWYLKIKLRLENNYTAYCELLPREGEILDLGCGYGFISYMLAFTSEHRYITGVDHDAEKIRIAEHAYNVNNHITFACADVCEYNIQEHDGFLLSDVLHYLPPQKQQSLLRRCFENLNPGGVVLIREANSDLVQRHGRSRITEFLSTRTGFNKTTDSKKVLHFTSAEHIKAIAAEYGMVMQVIDNKKYTSNNLFVVTKPGSQNRTGR